MAQFDDSTALPLGGQAVARVQGDAETTLFPPAPLVPEVSVESFRVVEINGDQDGYPDSNETLNLFLTLRNPTLFQDLTNVAVEIAAGDPKIDCINPAAVTLPSLLAGSVVEVATPFRLHVHPNVDRSGASVVCEGPGPTGTCSNFVQVSGGCVAAADCYRTVQDDYSVKLAVSITSDQFPASGPRSPAIILDLDLNSSTPTIATSTFVEGFELGFGNFTFQNLDANMASNSLSDGYRCQYHDPDFPGSLSYGETYCYLGFQSGQNPVNDWHGHDTTAPDGGRAFEGTRSLHYGKHTAGNQGLDTYGLSQLDAMRSRVPINLAARVCGDDPAPNKKACGASADCLAVGRGPCIAANPVLSLKQQISLPDDRALPLAQPNGTIDRAVVAALVNASTTWQKLHPFENLYNAQDSTRHSDCTFDPIDDGNDEDDYFDPTDPNRRYGPSSTCYPEFVFSDLGDTDEPYDPAKIGRASDGPGLQGSLGTGTWVESRFDLSRFRGRAIRIRFLLTSVNVADDPTWEFWQQWNPSPYDDGWYIDDVRVTQTLGTASPTVTLDGADNSALQPGNLDGDARGDECDCAPADPTLFAVPGELTRLRLAQDKVTLSWDSALPTSGAATVHDAVRGMLGALPVGAGASEICLVSGTSAATATDPENPPVRDGFWYVVRGRNACGAGSYGSLSSGAERVTSTCP